MQYVAVTACFRRLTELFLLQVHVFQAFPFLEQARQAFHSARSFVREDLAPLDTTTPRKLQGNTEEKLEKEIDNEAAQVVQGDGSESRSQKDEMVQRNPKRSQTPLPRPSLSTGSEEGSSSQDEEPSWVSPSVYPLSPPSPDTDEDEPATSIAEGQKGLSRSDMTKSASSIRSTTPTWSSTSTRSRASSLGSSFWSSPLSSLSSLASSSESSHSASSSAGSSLRRVQSRVYLRSETETPTSSHPPTRHYQLSSSTEHAPRPTIRRSSGSHPDISSLCAQWASSGPANRTSVYKPDTLPSRRRKHSSSVSSFMIPSS